MLDLTCLPSHASRGPRVRRAIDTRVRHIRQQRRQASRADEVLPPLTSARTSQPTLCGICVFLWPGEEKLRKQSRQENPGFTVSKL